MLVIETYGQAVAGEERGALIPRYAQHPVLGVEVRLLGLFSGVVAVVNPVPAPVIEEAHGAGSAVVTIFQCEGGHAACDARVVVYIRIVGFAGIGGVEAGDVHVAPQLPGVAEVVSQFGIAAILLKFHVVTVSVGTVVRAGHHAAETPFPHAVGDFRLQGIVGTVSYLRIGFHPVLLHLAGDDVDNPAHCIGPIEDGGGTAQHFHPFGHHALVGVGDGMPHQAHVLRMSVYQHQQAGRRSSGCVYSGAYTAQAHASCGSRGYAVAHDAAACGEKSGHLLGQCRQDGGLVGLFQLPAAHYGDGHWQVADVCFISCPGHYDFIKLVAFQPEAVGRCGQHTTRKGDTY